MNVPGGQTLFYCRLFLGLFFMVTLPPRIYLLWLPCHHMFIYDGYTVTTCLFMMVTLSPRNSL